MQFPPLRVYEDPIFLLCTLLKAKEYYAVPDVVYRYNGTHSNKRITLACTKDYLRGLIAELKLSKKKDLPEIHTLCCDRLMREADFYAQRFLKTEDPGAARTITRGKRRRFTAAAQGPAGGRQRHLARFAHHLARGLPLSALAGSAHHPHAMRRVCKVAMRAKRSFFNAFSGFSASLFPSHSALSFRGSCSCSSVPKPTACSPLHSRRLCILTCLKAVSARQRCGTL